MPNSEQLLIDQLYDGELEDLPTTTSGEDHFVRECHECHEVDGRHHYHCTFNSDLWYEDES